VLPAYSYDPAAGTYTNTNNVLQTPAYVVSGGNSTLVRQLVLNTSVNYDRTFGDHHVRALVLYNQTTVDDRYLLPVNSTGFTSRFDYDFKSKYLFEVTVARNGTDKYLGSKRFGVFPAIALGYNIAEEPFFHKAVPFVDLFKLRGTYGLVGSDQGPAGGSTGQVYSPGSNYNFGAGAGATATGIVEGALLNTDINWEVERQTDLGVDINMFKNLRLTADYFNRYRYDQVITPTNISLVFGQTLGQYNLGKTKDWGFEFELSYNGTIGKVNYAISPQISYAKNKIIYSGQVAAYPYLSLDGQPIGMSTGYVADGFYTQADIDAINAGKLAKPSVPVKPGYLHYEDLNGDGVIDSRDQAIIGKPNLPTTIAGLDLKAGYKNFSFDVLFQTASDYDLRIFSQGQDPFHSNLQPIVLERWTPATAATARYPILSTKSDSYNYSWLNNSTYWMTPIQYLRLKQLMISYTLPNKISQYLHLRNLSLTASGYNLITWDNFDRYQQDAEASSTTSASSTDRSQTAYPNTRQFLFGIRVGF
jgi:TonB-linked SusC/RagA family outer membrane protein